MTVVNGVRCHVADARGHGVFLALKFFTDCVRARPTAVSRLSAMILGGSSS